MKAVADVVELLNILQIGILVKKSTYRNLLVKDVVETNPKLVLHTCALACQMIVCM